MISKPSFVGLLAIASPILALTVPTRSANPSKQLQERATCTFTSAASAIASKAACATIVLDAVAVPAGVTLDLTDLTKGTHVIFEGETTFGFEEWSGPLVSISGTDITITAASGAYFNGQGSRWWDGQGSNGGVTKPTFFYAHNLIDSSITGLYFQDSPVQVMSIDDSTSLTITDVTVNNANGNTGNTATAATNTDAFDIGSSTGITITGANILNQDDCVAINSGTTITFTGGVCSGSHGLSVGSVGGRDDNTVSDVLFENSEVTGGQNAVRIKTVSGATGTVSGVTYSNIEFSGQTIYGIVIEQDYENGDPTGVPTNGIAISGLVLDNVKGTVASGATNIYILCGSGSCTDWTWTDVASTGGKTSAKCENIPSVATCA